MKLKQLKLPLFFILSIHLLIFNCGPIKSIYVKKDYDSGGKDAIKTVKIIVIGKDTSSEIAGLLLKISGDHIKIRRNYTVKDLKIINSRWEEECKNIDGIINLKINSISISDKEARISIKSELYKCPSGILIWDTIGETAENSENDELTSLVKIYQREFGETAKNYAAPLFILLRDMIDTMPNPPNEKIAPENMEFYK